mmetsp:Transcript_15538/g.62565  ORF Transcript_15538/g.62565 Transcript_15538/m.62565 type:complete len:84 (-) Transcript_15538:790-1041(-)
MRGLDGDMLTLGDTSEGRKEGRTEPLLCPEIPTCRRRQMIITPQSSGTPNRVTHHLTPRRHSTKKKQAWSAGRWRRGVSRRRL